MADEKWIFTENTPDNPKWEEAGRVHDWRNYVGERAQALWETFTAEQKLALALDAFDLAGNENWE